MTISVDLTFADGTTLTRNDTDGTGDFMFVAENKDHSVQIQKLFDDADLEEWIVLLKNRESIGDGNGPHQNSHPEIQIRVDFDGHGTVSQDIRSVDDTPASGYETTSGDYIGVRNGSILKIARGADSNSGYWQAYSSSETQHVRPWYARTTNGSFDPLSTTRPTLPGGRCVAYRVFVTNNIEYATFPKETTSVFAAVSGDVNRRVQVDFDQLPQLYQNMMDTYALVDYNGSNIWADDTSLPDYSSYIRRFIGGLARTDVPGNGVYLNDSENTDKRLLKLDIDDNDSWHPLAYGSSAWDSDGLTCNFYETVKALGHAWYWKVATGSTTGDPGRRWAWYLYDLAATWTSTCGTCWSDNSNYGDGWHEKSVRAPNSTTDQANVPGAQSVRCYPGGGGLSLSQGYKMYHDNYRYAGFIGHDFMTSGLTANREWQRNEAYWTWDGNFGPRRRTWSIRAMASLYADTSGASDLAALQYAADNLEDKNGLDSPAFGGNTGINGTWPGLGGVPVGWSNNFEHYKCILSFAAYADATQDRERYRNIITQAGDFMFEFLLQSYNTSNDYPIYIWSTDLTTALYVPSPGGVTDYASVASWRDKLNLPTPQYEFSRTYAVRAGLEYLLAISGDIGSTTGQRIENMFNRYGTMMIGGINVTYDIDEVQAPGYAPGHPLSTTVSNVQIEENIPSPDSYWTYRNERTNEKQTMCMLALATDSTSALMKLKSFTGGTVPPSPVDPPTGLSLINIDWNSGEIAWYNNDEDVDVYIFQQRVSGAPEFFSPAFQLVSEQGEATGHVYKGLSEETDYEFRVLAYDLEGDSLEASTGLFVTTPSAPPTQIYPPLTLAASPPNGSVNPTITWTDNPLQATGVTYQIQFVNTVSKSAGYTDVIGGTGIATGVNQFLMTGENTLIGEADVPIRMRAREDGDTDNVSEWAFITYSTTQDPEERLEMEIAATALTSFIIDFPSDTLEYAYQVNFSHYNSMVYDVDIASGLSASTTFPYAYTGSCAWTSYNKNIGWRSDYTQIIANGYQDWNRIRNCEDSTGQFVINSFAMGYEEVHRYWAEKKRNLFLDTADRTQPWRVYRVGLPSHIDLDEQDSRQLLVNAGFKNPSVARYNLPSDWTDLWDYSSGNVTHYSGEGVSAGGCVRMEVETGQRGYIGQTQDIVAPANQPMTFSVWHKNYDDVWYTGDSRTFMRVSVTYDNDTIDTFEKDLQDVTSGKWVHTEMVFTGQYDIGRIQVGVEVNNFTGVDSTREFFFDAFQLEAGTTATDWRPGPVDPPEWLRREGEFYTPLFAVECWLSGETVTGSIVGYEATGLSQIKIPLYHIQDAEKMINRDLPPTRVSWTPETGNLIGITNKLYGVISSNIDSPREKAWKIGEIGQTIDTYVWPNIEDTGRSFAIIEPNLEKLAVRSPLASNQFDLFHRYALPLDHVCGKGYNINLSALTIRDDKIWAFGSESWTGETYNVLKLVCPKAEYNKDYLELIRDYKLEGLSGTITSAGFVEADPPRILVTLIGDGLEYSGAVINLHHDYFTFDPETRQVYTRDPYTGNNEQLVIV